MKPISTKDNLQFILGALGIVICAGALVYLLYSLNTIGLLISLILSGLGVAAWWRWAYRLEFVFATKPKGQTLLLYGIYYGLWLAALYFILRHDSDRAIVSLWSVLPLNWFWLYGAATAWLVGLILIGQRRLPLFVIQSHYFLSLSLALLIYKIGYGFDPFIHQAAIKLIEQNGVVEPKSLYYAGQYALEIITHRLIWLPVDLIDRWLVPLLASITLPALGLKLLNKDQRTADLTLISALLLPLGAFIVTTPQNLAYLLVIATVIFSWRAENKKDLSTVALCSLAAFLVHPLAGLPALFFMAVNYLKFLKLGFKNQLYTMLMFFNTVALPLSFYFVEKNLNPWQFNLLWSNLKIIFRPFSLPNLHEPALNFAYLLINNRSYLLVALIIAGLWLERRFLKDWTNKAGLHLRHSLSLLLAYYLTQILPFNYLIDYERGNYTNRLLTLALIFALPFMARAWQTLWLHWSGAPRRLSWPLSLCLVLFISASLYGNYPRQDDYIDTHGYATSASDLKAAAWINQDADQAIDYIVLANQQVSAGALRLYGFAKYYEGDIFYYPLPTGGPLYQYYLTMTKTPRRETMHEAMALADVKTAYFVINDYWWQAKRVIAECQILADSYEVIDERVYIFKFTR